MQYQASCTPKLDRKCEIEHWLPCGADGREVYGHVIKKFSGLGRSTYPWCSTNALRAPELRYKWGYDRRSGITVAYIGRTSRLSSFYRISNHKNLTLKISLKFRNIEAAIGGKSSRKRFWKKFPLPRNTGASKIGSGVISLLWQQRCHCNPDHKKFSSLCNAAVVDTFSKSLL